MLSEETIRKMQCAAADLGFISARKLLEAYGYSVAAEESGLTAIVAVTDDKRAKKKKEKRQISTYSERKAGYLRRLPVVTAVPDFKDKISLILYEDIAPQLNMPLSDDDKRAFEFLKMELPDYDRLFSGSAECESAAVTGEYDV